MERVRKATLDTTGARRCDRKSRATLVLFYSRVVPFSSVSNRHAGLLRRDGHGVAHQPSSLP